MGCQFEPTVTGLKKLPIAIGKIQGQKQQGWKKHEAEVVVLVAVAAVAAAVVVVAAVCGVGSGDGDGRPLVRVIMLLVNLTCCQLLQVLYIQ